MSGGHCLSERLSLRSESYPAEHEVHGMVGSAPPRPRPHGPAAGSASAPPPGSPTPALFILIKRLILRPHRYKAMTGRRSLSEELARPRPAPGTAIHRQPQAATATPQGARPHSAEQPSHLSLHTAMAIHSLLGRPNSAALSPATERQPRIPTMIRSL